MDTDEYTRPKLDGSGTAIKMLVPVRPTRSATVMIEGDGLPTRIGVGGPDLPATAWLDIVNRSVPEGAYDRVTRILGGPVALGDKFIQGGDEMCYLNGSTFLTGTRETPDGPAVPVREGDTEEKENTTSAWLIMDSKGAKMLLTVPYGPDSFDVAEWLVPLMAGDFSVDAVTSGVCRAAGDVRCPGWPLVVDSSAGENIPPPGMRH